MVRTLFICIVFSISLLGCVNEKPLSIPADSFSNRSVLSALGEGKGFVTQDDCPFHEQNDPGAYRIQCSSVHLHWYPDSSTFFSMNFLGGARERDSVYSRIISMEEENIEGAVTKVSFIESVPPSFNCPPCMPSLGVLIWALQDTNSYRLLSENFNVANIGQNGLIASAPQKLALKKDRNGYLFTQTTLFQGITETEVVVMGIVEGQFRVLLKMITESDNKGACEEPFGCFEYTSELDTKEDAEQPLNDIVLTSNGTRMTEDGVEEFRSISVYRFDGTTYKLESTVER